MSEHVSLEIAFRRHLDDDGGKLYSQATAWNDCLRGMATGSHQLERRMEKVPLLLLKGDKGRRNSECYEPAVVSLGPYHHNRPALAQAEKYKLITLHEYCLIIKKSEEELYKKVFEVVHDARKCYIDGSTDAYNDHEFNLMMLRDACFILLYIECVACGYITIFLNNEHLGAIASGNVMRDLLLLENQIPFIVLQALLNFHKDNGEDVLNKFFNYLNYGEARKTDKKVLQYGRPLHLLELYRLYFISLPIKMEAINERGIDICLKPNQAFASVTELKARWIFLRCTYLV